MTKLIVFYYWVYVVKNIVKNYCFVFPFPCYFWNIYIETDSQPDRQPPGRPVDNHTSQAHTHGFKES